VRIIAVDARHTETSNSKTHRSISAVSRRPSALQREPGVDAIAG
jgi:hypothetical protein